MDQLLICATNWLGDTVMSMPALQVFRRQAPDTHLTLLAKPGMVPLLRMHPAVDDVVPLLSGHKGTLLTARSLRARSFKRAVIFPNSFRSALVPFLARIPQRVGVSAHGRRLLLSETRPGRSGDDRSHQAWEYFRLLDLSTGDVIPPPRIVPPAPALAEADTLLETDARTRHIAMLPGAARGSSKRWPTEHFATVAEQLVGDDGVKLVLLGTAAEREACDYIAARVGDAACNLAGRTSLTTLAAALSRCVTAVSNDSGGMHLATALGVPVVAIFGLTDPALTGPLGAENRVLCGAPAAARTRDVPRESVAATAALRAVTPDRVLASIRDILEMP